MDTSIIFTKTAKGVLELKHKARTLPALIVITLSKVDGRSSVAQLCANLAQPERMALENALTALESQSMIRVFVRAQSADMSEGEMSAALPSIAALQVEELNAHEGTMAWAQARRGVQQLVQQGFYATGQPRGGAPSAGVGSHILIVEDDAAISHLMQIFLTRQGYQVNVVADGRDALLALDEGAPPNLVLLDVNLPNINGFDILTYIRAHERLKELPAIMVTAQVSDADVLRGLRGGADGYIFKPFEWSVLHGGVQRVLGQHNGSKL